MSRSSHVAAYFQAHPLGTALVVDVMTALLLSARAIIKGEVLGSPGDPEAYMWTMQWGPYALTHGQPLLFTRHVIFPDGANLVWNASPIIGMIFWPITTLFGSIASYNALEIIGLSLSAWCAQIAFRRIVGGLGGPFIGGMLYGFSPYMTAHAGQHAALVVAVVPPLLLLAFHELLVRRVRPPWQCGGCIGVLLAFQLVVFLETVAIAALGILLALVVLALLYPALVRERIRPLIHAGVAAATSFLVLAAIPLWVMLRGDQRLSGDIHPPSTYVIDLANLLIATPVQWLSPGPGASSSWTGNTWEWDGYFGIPLLAILLLVAVSRRRDRGVLFAALTTTLLLLLALGPAVHVGGHVSDVPLPEGLLARLPLLSNLLPSRFMLVDYLFAGLLLSHAPPLLQRVPSSLQLRVALVGGIALVATLIPTPFPVYPLSVPAFFTSDALHRLVPQDSTMLVLPFVESAATSSAMAWQARADFWFRMPEGYMFVPGPEGPSQGPPVTPFMVAAGNVESGMAPPRLDAMQRAGFAAEFARWRVGSIAVGPMAHEGAMVAMITDLTGRAPQSINGVEFWSQVSSRKDGVGSATDVLLQCTC